MMFSNMFDYTGSKMVEEEKDEEERKKEKINGILEEIKNDKRDSHKEFRREAYHLSNLAPKIKSFYFDQLYEYVKYDEDEIELKDRIEDFLIHKFVNMRNRDRETLLSELRKLTHEKHSPMVQVLDVLASQKFYQSKTRRSKARLPSEDCMFTRNREGDIILNDEFNLSLYFLKERQNSISKNASEDDIKEVIKTQLKNGYVSTHIISSESTQQSGHAIQRQWIEKIIKEDGHYKIIHINGTSELIIGNPVARSNLSSIEIASPAAVSNIGQESVIRGEVAVKIYDRNCGFIKLNDIESIESSLTLLDLVTKRDNVDGETYYNKINYISGSPDDTTFYARIPYAEKYANCQTYAASSMRSTRKSSSSSFCLKSIFSPYYRNIRLNDEIKCAQQLYELNDELREFETNIGGFKIENEEHINYLVDHVFKKEKILNSIHFKNENLMNQLFSSALTILSGTRRHRSIIPKRKLPLSPPSPSSKSPTRKLSPRPLFSSSLPPSSSMSSPLMTIFRSVTNPITSNIPGNRGGRKSKKTKKRIRHISSINRVLNRRSLLR